ncbi:MAG: response regulator [Candidatus Lokiarchaeota archaeon]|nr:response regulator [Candidatus Lokiarchaeota archaeon]
MDYTTKRILVADSIPHVRFMIYNVLTEMYHVSCVSTGRQLYVMLTECKNDFDLVIADIGMNGYGSIESVEMAKVFGCDIPILFTTSDMSIAGDLPRRSYLLMKPFTSIDLMTSVKNILSKTQSSF